MFDALPARTPFLALLCAVLSSVFAFAQDGAAVRTTIFRGAEIAYEVIDGLAVYQGDIILGTAEEVAGWTAQSSPLTSRRSPLVRGAVPRGYGRSGLFCTWPDGVVPYVIDADVPPRERQQLLEAIRTWNDQTVLPSSLGNRCTRTTCASLSGLRVEAGPAPMSTAGEGLGSPECRSNPTTPPTTFFTSLVTKSVWSTKTSAGTVTDG